MHLRQPYNRHTHTPLGCGLCCLLRLPRYVSRDRWRIALRAHMPRSAARQSRPGGHDQQLAWFKDGTQRLNSLALVLPVLRKLRKVMVEGQVHHGIHARRSAAQAVEVFKRAALHLGTRCPQLLGTCIAACPTAHLMPCLNEFFHQLCPNESRRSRHKNSHRPSPHFVM